MSVILTLKVVLIYNFTEKNVKIFQNAFFSMVADHLVTVAIVT